MGRDHVGPVVGEPVPRTIDDVADEVVCRVSGNVEHSRADACISATHEALGSARVIGTCLATGEAAGIAAADHAA